MPSLTTLAIIAVAGVVSYGLGRALLARLVGAGGDAERASRAQADLRVAKEQGRIMAEQRTADDVADDLDHGRF
jgi:hypothetical protein